MLFMVLDNHYFFKLRNWAVAKILKENVLLKYYHTMKISVGWKYCCNFCTCTYGHNLNNLYQIIISACAGTVNDLNDLPSNTSCYISTSCTDVRCCVEIPSLNNFTVDFMVSLDDCQKRLDIRIEKWTHSEMLHNYTWGAEQYFWVRGIYRVR